MPKFCPKCGTALPYDDAKFCSDCGTKLGGDGGEHVHDTEDAPPELDPSATWTDKDMLKAKSKEELVNIVLQGKMADPTGTDELSFDPRKIPFGPAVFEADVTVAARMFQRVPKDAPSDAKILHRLVLISANNQNQPLGLELRGDAVIGRETQGVEPDVDLTPYGGGILGVSRRHAIFRVTEDHLILIDLASKNGTYLNGSKMEAGVPKAVTDMDVVSFAGAHFLVKFIAALSSKK